MNRPAPASPADGFDRALELVGDRWTLRVVEGLGAGTVRFSDLGGRLGIATNVLADRLRRLERAGLVIATPYQRRPVRLDYVLTDEGRRLAGAIAQLAAWGAERDGRRGVRRRHDVCGSELELRHWCLTCDQVVETGDDGDGPIGGGDSGGLVWV